MAKLVGSVWGETSDFIGGPAVPSGTHFKEHLGVYHGRNDQH